MAKSFSASLPRGTNLCCITTRGDNIRGNVVATDEKFGALVISKFVIFSRKKKVVLLTIHMLRS